LDNNVFRNIHKDSSGILLGSGPSMLESADLVARLQSDNFLLFGNNESMFSRDRFKFDLDYHVICDIDVFRKLAREYVEYRPRKLKFLYPFYPHEEQYMAEIIGCDVQDLYRRTAAYKLCGLEGENSLTFLREDGFANQAWEGSSLTSLSLMAQMMLIMGLKEILLAGIDCSSDNIFRAKGSLCGRGYSHHIDSWRNFKQYVSLNWPGVSVKSINPKGLKGIFLEYD